MTKPRIILTVLVTIIVVLIVYLIYTAMKSKDAVNNANVQAFLRMIRYAEGTDGSNGYSIMFGGTRSNPKTFSGFDSHPNVKNCIGTAPNQLCSTAAGAYQFLYSTWAYLATKLALTNFTPANQDLAAVELIREKGALQDVIAGNWTVAVAKVNKVWASLPGSPYGQPTKTLAELKTVYENEGGTLYA